MEILEMYTKKNMEVIICHYMVPFKPYSAMKHKDCQHFWLSVETALDCGRCLY